jgi:hypothetical protein
VIPVNIDVDTNNINLFSRIGSITEQVTVLVAIYAVVGSTSTGSYAFTCGTGWHPLSRVEVVVHQTGAILGKGGAAVSGHNATVSNGGTDSHANAGASNGTSGNSGGPGFDIGSLALGQLRIWNFSSIGIAGGGGSGASGGSGTGGANDGGKFTTYVDCAAGSGAGGAGAGASVGGTAGGGTGSGATANGNGGGSGAPTTTTGGSAGGGVYADNYGAMGVASGAGGAGGALGSSGGNSGGATYALNWNLDFLALGSAASGGAPGNAVNGNSKIIWERVGTIIGAMLG